MINNRLTEEQLYKKCDLDGIEFDTTDDLEDLSGIIGQGRALDALQFGTSINQDGYNLYAQGPAGLGKHSIIQQIVHEKAIHRQVPNDWCYVNNFQDAHNPIALSLPPGMGRQLQQDMEQLIEELKSSISSAFESDQYHARVEEINEEFKEKREQALLKLSNDAESHDITLLRTPTGFAFAPVVKGKVISPEEYEKLPEDEQKRIEQLVEVLEEELTNIIRQEPVWKKEARSKLKLLNKEVTELAVGHLITDLKKKYTDCEGVPEHLSNVQNDVIENVNDFRTSEETTYNPLMESEKPSFRRYQVNVICDNSDTEGAPVVYEDSPTYEALVGRIEHLSHMGALFTDFTMIKPGALHRANGGYLILDILKVLKQVYAWEGLKRTLFAKEIKTKSLGQIYSLISTESLDPQPVPLDIKVILIGDRLFYYLLCAYDDEFGELFKVSVDFEEHIERSQEHYLLYAKLIATLARKHKLLAMNRSAVERVIEYGSRLSSDAEKISTNMMSISDLVKESDYWAREQGDGVIERAHVDVAIHKQIYRANRLQERVYEHIQRKTILIDTEGEVVGQVNGLSVLGLGSYSFGQPSRITATARLGEGELVDIEREVDLGGSIHSKGVLILSSFIASRYSRDTPLSLTASLVFEQSYGGVEGDSATIAECCALLSVLSGIPIRQSIAVTGSMNQLGVAQAIGGVNEKIEGFFDICSQAGLNGNQGVIIPLANVDNLMLREDVVSAVREGKFHVYSYTNIDEAIHLLTGVEPGETDDSGNYPQNSVNYLVREKLTEFSQQRAEFVKQAKDDSPDIIQP